MAPVRFPPVLASVALTLAVLACSGSGDPAPQRDEAARRAGLRARAAPGVQGCVDCHADVVEAFLESGMADTLGPVPGEYPGLPAPGETGTPVGRPGLAWRYRLVHGADGLEILQERPGGGGLPPVGRSQPVVWRIGAGSQGLSLVTREAGRWFFGPLELYRSHGAELAPTELLDPPTGFTRPITPECLACHTTRPLPETWPRNQLGDLEPRGLECSACHGEVQEHEAWMRAVREDRRRWDGDPRILRLAGLAPEGQLEICARCHLEGEVRIELGPGGRPSFQPGGELFQTRAVFVEAEPSEEFRFVSQAERLVLSACFRQTPEMSCSTCHDAHRPAARDPRLAGSCLGCHPAVHAADGRDRSFGACLDCHMPRRDPYDLLHVRIRDHWIRRRPAPDDGEDRIRASDAVARGVRLFRWREEAASPWRPEEEAWLHGLAEIREGRFGAALERMAGMPEAGSLAAGRTRPEGLLAVALLHFQRGRALAESGRPGAAARAWEDALSLEPEMPEARMNLAWVELELGRVEAALSRARELAAEYPAAEAPWRLLGSAAARAGDLETAASAFRASLQRFPPQAPVWRTLGRIEARRGRVPQAREALLQALRLDPGLAGLLDELRALEQDGGR